MIKFFKKCWKSSKYYSIATSFFIAETPITILTSNPRDKLSFLIAVLTIVSAAVNIYSLLKEIHIYEDGGLL